jgi:hypothetical protein
VDLKILKERFLQSIKRSKNGKPMPKATLHDKLRQLGIFASSFVPYAKGSLSQD